MGAFQAFVRGGTILGLHVTSLLTVGDLLVGGGTVLLALLTYFAVRVARQSLVAQDAPLVIGAHVPRDTEVAKRIKGVNFDLPRAGLLPDGYSPSFLMRLWNVGRGPAVVHDVRLDFGHGDALGPMPSHAVVNAGAARDEMWMSLDVPDDQKDAQHKGSLHIIYAHPNGQLLETVSNVELYQRALSFRTIQRRRSRWWRRRSRPRQPGESQSP